MADIDPRIPLAVQPSPFNPLGAAQAGMQMQGEKQLQQLRQQQIESFPQLQEAREQQLDAGRYENMIRRRNIAATMEYVKQLQSGVSDQQLVEAMTKAGFPEMADLHLERRAKAQQAYDNMQRASLGLEQTQLATAVSELDGIESSKNPELDYAGAVSRLQNRFGDNPGLGNWAAKLPVQYPGPEGLKGLRQTLQNRSAVIQRTLDPTGVAGKEAETRLHGAQADLAAAEAEFYKKFGGGKLPPETAMALQSASKKLYGKNFGDLTDEERIPVYGAAKDLLMSPEQRQMLALAAQSRSMNNLLTQMMLKQMGVTTPGAGGGAPVQIDDKRPDPTDPAANKGVPEWGGLTPNQVYQSALQSLATGTPPPQGFGGNPIRTMQARAIDSKAAAIAASAGMDRPTFQAFYKANSASLTQQVKAMDTVGQLLRTADSNSVLLDKAAEGISDTGSPFFNLPLREFEKKVAGDKSLSGFGAALRSVQNEYARILTANASGGGGGVLSDSARHEAEQLIDPNSTVAQMGEALRMLRAEGGNRVNSIGEQVRQIYARIQAGPAGATTGAGTTRTLDVATLPPAIKAAFDQGKTIQGPDGVKWQKGPTGQAVQVK